MLTANGNDREWGQAFHDSVRATAVLNRMLRRSVAGNMKGGQSHRFSPGGSPVALHRDVGRWRHVGPRSHSPGVSEGQVYQMTSTR
ncbi:MAG: ATP-binding protein [Firmicutes bacterium]|nr:ATP-binding protein [Bacillota bacterium]